MSRKLPRKWFNRHGLLPASLVAFITLGAIVGTVLLTAAPGTASPRPRNLIVRVLDFILPGKEKQESSLGTPVPKTANHGRTPSNPAGGVSRDVAAASKTVTTATTNGIRTDSGRIADGFAGNNTMTFPRIETGTKTQSGANTRSGGTTSSGGTLATGSGSTANGEVSASGTTTAAVVDPDGTWTANANGNWSTTTNWSGGIVADGGGFANFSTLNITANRTVTIDTISRTVRRIDIGDTNSTNSYIIAAGAGLSLIFDNTANSANAQLNEVLNSNGDTISAPIVLNSSLDITNVSAPAATLTLSGGITAGTAGTKIITTSTGAVTISGVIGDGSGTVAVTQNGSGTLTLSGTNTFSGLLTVQSGTLSIATINNSGSNGVLGNSTNAVVLGGSGTTGTLDYTGGNASSTKKFTMATGGTGVFQIDTAATTLTLSGVIDGGGDLTKSGAGTLALSGTNTYTGATTISAGTLQLGSGGTTGSLSTSSTITDNGNFTINRSNAVTQGTDFSGSAITGTGSLTQAGTGTTTLNAANTYTGATMISAGILNIQNATALGTTAAGTTVSSGATLQLQGGITVGAEALSLSGTGAAGQNGALVNVSGTNDYGGPITLAANTTISSDSDTLNLNGTVNLNSHGLTVSGSGDTLITGVISGAGATSTVTKSGSGTLTVTNANTYAGSTTVNGGTLLVNNTTGSGTGNQTVTVNNSGSTLGGTGTISGAVTVNAGANLAPGNGDHNTAIFSVKNLTLQSGSNFLIDINGTTVGTGYDQLQVTGAGGKGGAVITDSNLLVYVGTTLTIGQTFDIAHHAGGFSGTFAQGSTVTADNGYIFSIDYTGGPQGYDIILTFTEVPEPSTWFAGALVLIVLSYTQRRRLARCAKHLPVAAAVPAAISAMRLRICSRAGRRSSLPFCRRHACHYSAPAVAFLLLIPIGNAKAIPLKEARVTQVIQDVRLLESSASPRPASINDDVREGTAVRTGSESRAELTFTDQTLTRLGANTLFNFNAESRTVELGSGAVLIYVPKNAGGAKIRAGTVTGAITGTTVTVEYDRRPPGFIKYTVLEGSMCIRLNGEAVPIYAGQQLVFSPNATSLPQPVSIDLKRLLETSQLTAGSPRPLPSAALIAGEAQHQRETRAIIDQLVHAVTLAGVASAKDASATKFISAFSSLVIRAKDEEVCLYAIAAVTLRPDLIGEILVATRKSRKGEPRFTCECLERIIRAAIAADSKAAGTIVQAVLYAEPNARECIGQADPCQQGTNNLLVPAQTDTIDPANLIPDPAVVSPER